MTIPLAIPLATPRAIQAKQEVTHSSCNQQIITSSAVTHRNYDNLGMWGSNVATTKRTTTPSEAGGFFGSKNNFGFTATKPTSSNVRFFKGENSTNINYRMLGIFNQKHKQLCLLQKIPLILVRISDKRQRRAHSLRNLKIAGISARISEKQL